jgi:hypothetical protein
MGALPISIGSHTDGFDGPGLELHFEASLGGFYGTGTLALGSDIRTCNRISAAHSGGVVRHRIALQVCCGSSPTVRGARVPGGSTPLALVSRLSPVLFLIGPLAAACLNLATLIKLEARREDDRVVTTITFTPRAANIVVAVASLVLLAILAGYLMAENLGSS